MLGDLIQIKRYEKRLTVWQLAQKMGIATVTVRAWEGGSERPSDQQMEQMATILGFVNIECAPFVVYKFMPL